MISGTSAGGINGIFLGKALANGQNLDGLKRLWIDEGDIQVLINDKVSVSPPLKLQNPPQSLLNSQRLYAKLLKAFIDMDADGVSEPHVDELDIFLPRPTSRECSCPSGLPTALSSSAVTGMSFTSSSSESDSRQRTRHERFRSG